MISAFIVIFYDAFKEILRPKIPDLNPEILVIAIAGVSAVLVGLILLAFFVYITRNDKETPNQ